MRRLLVLAALLAGAAAVLLRRREARRDRVTIGYEDGSTITLEPGTPDGDRLLELARRAVPA